MSKKFLMLVKDLNIKTLVTGDKSCWVKLETLYPEDIEQLKNLADVREVKVSFEGIHENKQEKN